MSQRWRIALLCLMVLVVCPFLGMTAIPEQVLWHPFATTPELQSASTIFWDIRLPRVTLAFLAGAALSVGGLVFQGIFRNFLACPFTLGVSTGAAFGAALYFRLGLPFLFLGLSGASLSAFGGALGTVLFIYAISAGMSAASMLLAGIVMSFFFSSLIIFLQYISDYQGMFRIMRWLMGGFETVGWANVIGVLPFVVCGLLIVRTAERGLDLLTLGDSLAASRGVQVSRLRMLLFIATSLMVGGVVSVCGPVGFVGIMVPHACRMVFGTRVSGMSMLAGLLGGTFLALCDSLGRVLVPPFEVPVGVITALLGGPFFLWIMLSRRSNRT